MLVSIEDNIEFYRESCERSEKYLRDGISTGNENVILCNYRYLFNCKMLVGLYTWKSGLDISVNYFHEAIDIANEAVINISKCLPEIKIEREFPIEKAAILSYLVDKEFKMPNYKSSGLSLEGKLNFVLINSLKGTINEDEWKSLLSKKVPANQELMIKTYQVYQKLLSTKNKDEIRMLVKDGEELFKQRRTNSYYGKAVKCEGGGDINDATVDYRLSAILKCIGHKGDSIHCWEWN